VGGDYNEEEESGDEFDEDRSRVGGGGGGGGVVEEKREKLKVEMQRLHMSVENQELARATLMEVRGGEVELQGRKDYKDSYRGLAGSYWVKDNKLLVRGGQDFSNPTEAWEKEEDFGKPSTEATSFGLRKMLNIGFHRSRCVEALDKTDSDVGGALEIIMSESYDIPLKFQSNKSSSDTEDSCPGAVISSKDDDDVDVVDNSDELKDLLEQKMDEKMALESIYESAFNEKIPGSVWELSLPLEHLWKYLPRDAKESTKKDFKKERGVCEYFTNGHCKFGNRCFKKHVQPEHLQKVEDGHLRGEKQEKIFRVEIRFPKGNRYPAEPCLVTFSTELLHFPKEHCMKITTRLMMESKAMAEDGQPSVFAVVSVLENFAELDEIIRGPTSKFSLPKPPTSDFPQKVVKNKVYEEKLSGSDALMQSLGRPEKIKQEEWQKEREKERRTRDDNERLIKRFQQVKVSGEDNHMMKTRQSLPAWKEQENIVKLVRDHQVVVISGMTGCGKSTQVPQFLLDSWLSGDSRSKHCSIVCTQPRRISAIGVADRVASERCDRTGGVVGYQIRLESKTSSKTRLLFCTTGILLRRLEGDPNLNDVTHIIVDEVHERSEESDFLLMILRDSLKVRPDLRVILMSATVNADLFSNYFGGVPVLDIPGRTFPVEAVFLEDVLALTRYTLEENSPYARKIHERDNRYDNAFAGDARDAYMDQLGGTDLLGAGENNFKPAKPGNPDEKCDPKQIYQRYAGCSDAVRKTLSIMDYEKINYDLIEAAVIYIADGGKKGAELPREGSILVFLPGMQEIMTLYDNLNSHPRLGSKAGRFLLVPLHSSLSNEEQALVFSKPKNGVRKIVISTNLAETSITIDDCVFVVDVGKMKEKRFDPNKNMESLDTVWVSKANALQRKGRAGRVRPGIAFHLYTSFRFDKHFRQDPIPEIQRVPLDRMILRIRILPFFKKKNVSSVLSNVLEPPAKDAINSALLRLQSVGALYPDHALTPLGYHLAQLPVDVRIGKLMLFGAIFRCLDAALTIAACLSYRTPFVSPFRERDAANKARLAFAAGNSDQLTQWRAYKAWSKAAQRGGQAGWAFCQENYLGCKTMQTIASVKHQFVELLASIGFIPGNVRARDLERSCRGKGGSDGVGLVTGPAINANCDNNRVVSAVLCAALYPNIVKVLTPEAKYKQTATGAMARPSRPEEIKFKTHADGYVNIHPSSVNHQVAYFESPYMVFHEKVKTSRVFVREVSMVPMYPMVLFGGTGVNVDLHRGESVISMEQNWIKFICDTHIIAELLKEMRLELDALLEDKISHPETDLLACPRGSAIIKTIVRLISTE